MKRISRKLTLALLMLLSCLLVFGGVFALRMPANADSPSASEESDVYDDEGKWYSVFYDMDADHLTFLLDANYKDYLDASRDDFDDIIAQFSNAFENILVDGIFGGLGAGEPEAHSVSYVSPAAITPGDIPQGSLTMDDIRKFLDEKLTPEDIVDFSNGKYDVLIGFAVENYLNSHPDEDFSGVQEQLEELLVEAVEKKFPPKEPDDPDYASWEEYRQQLLQDVLEQKDYVVQEVENNGGTYSFGILDILAVLNTVTVNGDVVIYKNNSFVLESFEKLLADVPRPSEIAEMSDREMESLVEYVFTVDTAYGDVNFTFTFGFRGDCSNIRTAARILDDHVDYSYVDGVYNVSVRLPELVSELYLSAANSETLTADQKNAFFSLFTTSVGDLVDRDDLKTTIFDTLRGVDYQHFFKNFISAEWLNGYVGEYFNDLTDAKVDEFVNDLIKLVKRAANASVDSIKDLLRGFVDNSRLNSAVEKLHNFLNKFHWDEIDAKTVRDRIARDDFNTTLYDYIDKLESYDDLYDTLLSYARKAVNFLPDNVQGKTLVELYRGDGLLTANGSKIVDVANVIKRVVNFLVNHGVDAGGLDEELLKYVGSQTLYRISFDAALTIPKVYKVTYSVNGETVREGLLPAGADVNVFADLTDVQGYEILYWYDADDAERKPCTEMPEGDVVLCPATEFVVRDFVDDGTGEIETAELNTVYKIERDGFVLSVKTEGVDYAEYTYQWFRRTEDGAEPIEDATADSLTLTDVAESGTYFVEVTDSETLVKVVSDDFTVVIDKLNVTVELSLLNDSEEAYAEPYVYDMERHYVKWDYTYTAEGYDSDFLAEYFVPDLPEDGRFLETTVGKYEATFGLYTSDDAALYLDNFVLGYTLGEDVVEETEVSVEWEIVKAKITASVVWTLEGETFTYDGTEQEFPAEVTAECDTLPATHRDVLDDILDWSYVDDDDFAHTGTAAKDYTAKVTVALKAEYEDNFELVPVDEEALVRDWTIGKAKITVDGSFSWFVNDGAVTGTDKEGVLTLVFADTDFTLTISDARFIFKLNGGDIEEADFTDILSVDYADNTAKNVCTLTAKATFSLRYPDNYMFDGLDLVEGDYVVEQDWAIVKSVITVTWGELQLGAEFSAPIEYDGEAHVPALTDESILAAVVKDGTGFTSVEDVKNYVNFVHAADSDTSGTEAKDYTTVFEAELVDSENYELVTNPADKTSVSFSWSIVNGEIDLTGAKWMVQKNSETPQEVTADGTGNFTFPAVYERGTTYTVTLKDLPDGVTSEDLIVVYLGGEEADSISGAGTYTVTVRETWNGRTVVMGDLGNLTVEIAKQVLDFSHVALQTTDFAHDGTPKTVTIIGEPDGLGTLYSRSVTGDTATDAGNHTVTITYTLVDSNCAINSVDNTQDTLTVTLDWTIYNDTVDLLIFKLDNDHFTWNGEEHEVDVVVNGELPEGVGFTKLPGSTLQAREVGEYEVIVSVQSNVAGRVLTFEHGNVDGHPEQIKLIWTIDKISLDLAQQGIALTADTFDFDNQPHTVAVNPDTVPASVRIVADGYTGNVTETAVGKYSVTVAFEFTDPDHYEFADGNTLTFSWAITTTVVYDQDGLRVEVLPGNQFDPATDEARAVSMGVSQYEDAIREKVQEKYGNSYDFSLGKAFDIYFMEKNGSSSDHLNDLGSFKVSILIPEDLREGERELAVIHIKDDGSIEFIDAQREGDYMVFEASSFSIYAVIEIHNVANLWWLWLLIAIILVLLIVTIVLLVILLKKKKANETPDEPTEEEPVEEPAEEPVEEPVEETAEPAAETVEEPVEETAEPAAETVEETAVAEPEPAPAPAPVAPVVPFVIPAGIDEKTLTAMLDKSFTARITQADDAVKQLYSDLKNEILSYKGVKSRVSWGYDTFNKGRNKCVKLQMKGKSLIMYIALDPNTLNASKYHHKDVSAVGKYAEYPTKLKLKSARSLKYAKELVEILMSMLGVPKGESANISYVLPYQSTETLLGLGLIKWKNAVLPEFWGSAPAAAGEVAATDEKKK